MVKLGGLQPKLRIQESPRGVECGGLMGLSKKQAKLVTFGQIWMIWLVNSQLTGVIQKGDQQWQWWWV